MDSNKDLLSQKDESSLLCGVAVACYGCTPRLDDEEGIPDGESVKPASLAKKRRQIDEVLGWGLDASARGVILMATAVFVSSELLRLAKEASVCVDSSEERGGEEDCRVHGMRPTSVLTNIVTITGLLSALIMPLAGSIIDHTDHRRAVGSISAAAITVFIFIQMFVMEDHWVTAAILQILVSVAYTVHLTVVYSYFPELTSDHGELTKLAAHFTGVQYGSSVAFLVMMVLILEAVNKDEEVNSAFLAQEVVVIVCCIFFATSWIRLFHSRSASQKVPENGSLVTAGFRKIYKTGKKILKDHAAIKWVLISVAFTEAATTTFATIAITYMTEQLSFEAEENGIAILILLLFSVPGAQIATRITKIFNPIRSLQACLCLWMVSITAAAVFLKHEGQQSLAYTFAVFWGLALGWTFPTEKTLYVTVIPRGQEAELMGTYICACQVLSWLPPLVFSMLNEAGYSMRLGVTSLAVFMLISFSILFLVGDYEQAVAHAKAVDEQQKQLSSGMKTSRTEDDHYREMD
ncbi:unnamed protein product [Cylindrotheca closterium]|uniref:Major facilitator superfamily (MFS) profile domain-containing protein n=1 Tax=Cylindrotheca closterium TaxID=2856 RepID=A0AAD2FVU0_9STRA|nr:unnamed protein product [Cylindrotheca closterium]